MTVGGIGARLPWAATLAVRTRVAASAATRAVRGFVNPIGLGVFAVAAVALGLGLGLGWIELVVPGLALAGLLVAAVVMTWGRSTFGVQLELAKDRVRIGERAYGRIVVANVGRRRLLPARITLPVGTNSADFALPSLAGSARFEDAFVIPTSRRSVVTVGPVRSTRGDPLGLVERGVEWTESVALYVHPETINLGAANAGLLRDLDGNSSRDLSDNDLSFHALREYVAGDDRRNIHWRSTARLGKLMVRQFEDTRRTRLALGLSLADAEFAAGADLELAVSVFASIGVQTLRDGRDLTTVADDAVLRAATPQSLLDACSGLEKRSRADGTATVARTITLRATDASLAVVITGGVPSLARVREAVAALARGVRVVAVACEKGSGIEVGGRGAVSYVRIGDLADLPQALRRAGAR